MFARSFKVSLLVLTALALLPAIADEGRIPVFAPGMFLGTPGRYFLTDNIVNCCSGTAAVTIGAPDVELDLNGFTIDDPCGCGDPKILIVSPAGSKVAIRNGTLINFGGTAQIENALPFGQNVIIEDVTTRSLGVGGIHLTDVQAAVIRHCVIVDPVGFPGILLDGGAVKHGTIENNVIRVDGPVAGIDVTSCSSLAILTNRIEDPTGGAPGGIGIGISGCTGALVSENTIENVGSDGLFVRGGKGNKLFDNVIRNAGAHGIHIDPGSSDGLALNNLATGCGFGPPAGGHGLFVEGDNYLIDRNVLNSNSGAGLFFSGLSSGNTFGRNSARANTGVGLPPCIGAPALFPPNSCNAAGAPPIVNSTFGDNLIPGPPIF